MVSCGVILTDTAARTPGQAARAAVWIVALAQAAIGLAILADVPAVLDRWPFPGTTPLTFTFLASFLLAASASSAWCILADEPAGLVGVGVDYVTILVPLMVFLVVADPDGSAGPLPLLVATAPTLAFGVWMIAAFRRTPAGAARTPTVVRGAFVVFATVLVAVAVALLAGVEVMPWPVSSDVGVVVGLMFLGAASYFVVGALAGTWTHAGGQLAGFLAYDLVLIGPLAARVPDIGSDDAVSLALYLTVIVSSGVLAAWYLFRGPGTPQPRLAQPVVPADGGRVGQ